MEAWLSLAGGIIIVLLGINVTLIRSFAKSVNDVKTNTADIKTEMAVVKTELHTGNNRFEKIDATLENHSDRIRALEVKVAK